MDKCVAILMEWYSIMDRCYTMQLMLRNPFLHLYKGGPIST